MKEKLTLLNYAELVPTEDHESVKMALTEINQTIFPFVIGVDYDKENNQYSVYWEPEKDGKERDVIAEEMTLDEFLVAQYSLCMAFETYAKKTSHASLDRKYIDAATNSSDISEDAEIFAANGIRIVPRMPCMFMRQTRHGVFREFDKGIVLGFTKNFVKIEPNDREKYRNPLTKEFQVIYRRPDRLVCGNYIDPLKKSPCQERAEKKLRDEAVEKVKNGEILDENTIKVFKEWSDEQDAKIKKNQEITDEDRTMLDFWNSIKENYKDQ